MIQKLKYSYQVQSEVEIDVLQSRFSLKFCKFHRKAPVLQSLFNKVKHNQKETSIQV